MIAHIPWRRLLSGSVLVVAVAVFSVRTNESAPDRLRSSSSNIATAPRDQLKNSMPATPKSEPGKPRAMNDPATYAATRLQTIKTDPLRWAMAETWHDEFALADSGELQHEVLGLAQQIGSEAFLAVLAQALASPEQLVRLEAARSIAFLHEHELLAGVSMGVSATDAEVRDEVMQVVSGAPSKLQPDLLRQTLSSSYPDVQERTVDLLTEHPSPAFFSILLEGMRTSDSRVGGIIRAAIETVVDRHFENLDEANRWWSANRERYDEMMLLAR